MPEFEPAPGWLFHRGVRFACPDCGNQDFKTELDVLPHRFHCECGVVYTEASMNALKDPEADAAEAAARAEAESGN